MKSRIFLIAAQILVTVLYLINYQNPASSSQTLSLIPLLLLGLIIINSFWCTRFTSWLIFAVAFFGFMVTLSAFTLRWRAEPHFEAAPFYRAIFMYVFMVYIGLVQMKLHFKYLPMKPEESNEK